MTWTRTVFFLALLLMLPYTRSVVYRFPPSVPFSGDRFYNPYPQWKVTWQRANFHAHGRAWSGLTSGRQQSNEEVVRTYRDHGYAVAGISNYHHISSPLPGSTLPIYEHGYNLRKRHQLAIGARGVEWFDLPLGQLVSHEQLIIDLIKKQSELVVLAHPAIRDAYSADNLAHLTGYQLIEVVNGQFPNYKPWDAALSAGRAVWGMANDDNHDLSEERRTATAWNMVNAPTASDSDVIDALRKGYFYSVMRLDTEPTADPTVLENVEFKDGTLTITCSGRIPAFEFFGQGGVIKKVVRDQLTASYTFDASDTYIRTIIWSPRHVFYLNPILRYDGIGLPTAVATVDRGATWTLRLAFVGLALTAVLIWRKRRQRLLSKAGQVETRADRDRKSA